MSDIEESEDQLYLQITSDFVYFWCKEYGLPDIVALYLDRKRIRNGDDIISLARKGIERKVLSSAEMTLLQGALHKYTLHRGVVDEIIGEKSSARREEMLKRAKLALKSGKSLEELEIARKIIVKVTLQEQAEGKLELTPEGTPRNLPVLHKKEKHEEKAKPSRSLAERIIRRREKLGFFDRSNSAPMDEEHLTVVRNHKSSLSSPSNIGYYNEVNESESRLRSQSKSQFGTNSPLPNIGNNNNNPEDPDDIVYLEDGTKEENNNVKEGKRKKKKKKKAKRERSDTESPKAFVTVECEINNMRPRSTSDPEKMKKSLANGLKKKKTHRLKPLNNDTNTSISNHDIDTIEIA